MSYLDFMCKATEAGFTERQADFMFEYIRNTVNALVRRIQKLEQFVDTEQP